MAAAHSRNRPLLRVENLHAPHEKTHYAQCELRAARYD